MARRRLPDAPSTSDTPPPELVGHARIEDWVTAEEWAECHIEDPNHHVTGGNNPGLRASAIAHRRQREARRQWSEERGLARSNWDWRRA